MSPPSTNSGEWLALGRHTRSLRALLRPLARPVTISIIRVLIVALRWRARANMRGIRKGAVTIVTVNWNSLPFLETLITMVERHSPASATILVVDNHSTDGSRAFLKSRRDIRHVLLPINIGHGLAMDIGFLCARTEYVIALDVDAFPLSSTWIDALLQPLHQGYTIAGARLNREYVHPCCLAIRLERFIRKAHTFDAEYHDGVGEVGEPMSHSDGGPLWFLDPTSQRGPGDVGTVFGGIVYHNFYSTRFRTVDDPTLDHVVARADPEKAWAEAVDRWVTPK